MRSLARWCVRHRRQAVLLWVLLLVLSTFAARAAGTRYSNDFNLPRTPSTEALDLLRSVSPQVAGDAEKVVFATSGGQTLDDPAIRSRVEDVIARLGRTPHVSQVVSPYTAAGAAQVSRDRTVAFASYTFDRLAFSLGDSFASTFVRTARSGAGDGLAVAVSGQLAEQANRPSIGGTGPGIILAGLVLLLVFGSVYAMLLPLVSALVSLGTALGLIGLLTHAMKVASFADQLVILIGLGVGVDYALFIVTRHRQGLVAGRSLEDSIVEAVNTSGRAVLFAGVTVCIALLGMFALGVSYLYGVAVAAAIGVALTMFAAVTLLPALLGFIGPRILSRRQKRDLAEHGPRVIGTGTRGFWVRWAGRVEQRPVVFATIGLVLVAAVALPYFSMRLGSSDQGNDPPSTTTRQAYDLLARGFGPGFNGTLQLVAVVHDPSDAQAVDRVAAAVGAQPDVGAVSPTVLIPARQGGSVALVNVFPRSAPQDKATTDLVNHLRSQTIPAAVGNSGLRVLVSGYTAVFIDFAHVLSLKLGLFIGVVVLLSFLLLAAVFRSLVIPLISAAMNMLSIGAAFGLLVATFQWGWLGDVFRVSRPGPIEAFLPVMLFAILFGLSMDYQVFLVTRFHEERLKSGSNRLAVRRGLAATGKTITAAALIMIFVFASFILGGQRIIREFGLGLAAGILIDAVLIRMAIVPSILLLTGEANWWLPRWLDRLLPHLDFEPSPDPVAGGAPAPAAAVGSAAAAVRSARSPGDGSHTPGGAPDAAPEAPPGRR